MQCLVEDMLVSTTNVLCLTADHLLQHPDKCVSVQMSMWKSETLVHVRAVSINQVLGTDMKKHFDITSRFQASFMFSWHARPTWLHLL